MAKRITRSKNSAYKKSTIEEVVALFRSKDIKHWANSVRNTFFFHNAWMKIRYPDLDITTCSCCGVKDWQGKPLFMDLDHKDGNPKNNRLSNLRVLCPNCHRQTKSYGGRVASLQEKYEDGLFLIEEGNARFFR